MKKFLGYRREDFSLIRTPLRATVIIMIICMGVYAGAWFFRDARQQAVHAAAATRQEAESSYHEAVKEERTIRHYLNRYRQLSVGGIIGDEDRLGLIERIGQVRERYRLYPIEVEIAPQISVAALPSGESQSGPSLHASEIHLSLNLLHEGDLVRLLESLDQGRGLMVAKACAIERLNPGSNSSVPPLTENLNASCRLFWITLQEQGS